MTRRAGVMAARTHCERAVMYPLLREACVEVHNLNERATDDDGRGERGTGVMMRGACEEQWCLVWISMVHVHTCCTAWALCLLMRRFNARVRIAPHRCTCAYCRVSVIARPTPEQQCVSSLHVYIIRGSRRHHSQTNVCGCGG